MADEGGFSHVAAKIPPGTHIALYVPTLAGGGAERVMLKLAGELARRGYTVDFVLNKRQGAYADHLPAGLRQVVTLQRRSKWQARLTVLRAFPGGWKEAILPVLLARTPVRNLRYVASLAEYLRRERPDVMISALFYANLAAIWARQLAGVPTRLVVSQRNTLSQLIAEGVESRRAAWRWRYLPALLNRCYARADRVVAVSDGVGDDLARMIELDRHKITTLYNPVVSKKLTQRAAEPAAHPWFVSADCPVILGVGRLEPQKDFHTLLSAFALLRARRKVRLVILGEGRLRPDLEARVQELGIGNDVRLPGWVDNPYSCMRSASVFVLSSAWEGLSAVLIEAMACGCPVVSTDCPSGSREILDDGRCGPLVPVGDAAALADAISHVLDVPTDATVLKQRAADFSIEASTDRYVDCIASLLS
ncbi:glycosyltransferase [Salinisphaera sp. LB1]|uniref:glycosyltransferase n=1 Tax=Salinisphaera sp. LB1 TaxID=2183911 RepID=UPI000D7E1B82|nr:glycosyltransferase [Salinisphaera sp. LB1]AWN14280.1 Glycosyl transferase, group 1 [Salinisphaera sp. LB1]